MNYCLAILSVNLIAEQNVGGEKLYLNLMAANQTAADRQVLLLNFGGVKINAQSKL